MRFKPVPPNWETDASIDATALPWRCRKPISALASPKLRTNSRRRERRLLEQAVPGLNRLGFPNRHCSDSTCWLGGGQQGWPVHIRKTCATG
jgi:hypothetical protein